VNDATRRAIRGLLQVATVEAFLRVLEAFGVPLSEDQHAALLVLASPLVAFAQNWLEDRGAIPALIKSPASSGVHPLPDDAGTP
jgi:hypothetical protein